MFDIAPSELLIVALVAIVLIGPKDLPRVMRVIGQWVGKGRALSRHFRGAIDDMIRESELEEMEKKWKAENERIMREHTDLMSSVTAPLPTPAAGLPAPDPAVSAEESATGATLHQPASAAHPHDGAPVSEDTASEAVAPATAAPAPAAREA